MSKFRLEIEYPQINYDWYIKNSDGSFRSPVNWDVVGETGLRYFKVNNEWILAIKKQATYNETAKVPIKINEIDFLTHTVTFDLNGFSSVGQTSFTVKLWFNDTNFTFINYDSSDSRITKTIVLPANTEYMKFEAVTAGVELNIYVDFDFKFQTSWIDINTELANFSTANNNRVSETVDGTLIVTSLAKRDVYYSNELIISNAERLELDSIIDLARLNNFTTIVSINNVEIARNSLGGLPTTATENIVKYYYVSHVSTQKTGLYEYVTLRYKNNNSNKYWV